MGNQRAGFGLDDDTIDIEELVETKPKPKPKPADKTKITEVAEQSGFTSREPAPRQRRRRKKSPFTDQQAIRVRPGMKSLFQDLGEHLDVMDHTTFEKAIEALIEKEGTDEQLVRFKELVS